MLNRIAMIMAVLGMVACSDDNGNDKDSAPLADGGGDKAVTDTSPGEGQTKVDSGLPCDPKVLGTSCTQGGGECGADHDCLIASGGAQGVCSCKCQPDDITTELFDEDSCPSPGRVCGAHGGDQYCFETLANTPQGPTCSASIAAAPTDDPFVLATRLTPPSYPFTVLGVQYMLMGPGTKNPDCDTGLAHEVQVWVGDQTTPDASPTLSETIAVAAGASDSARWISQELKTPIQLTSGQHLYIGLLVTYEKPANKSICPQACSDSALTGDKSFSNDSGSWKSFKDNAWPGDLSTAALGFAE